MKQQQLKKGDYVIAENKKDDYLVKGVIIAIKQTENSTSYLIQEPGGQMRTINTLTFIVQLLPLLAQIIDFISGYAEEWFGTKAERRARRTYRRNARLAKKGEDV